MPRLSMFSKKVIQTIFNTIFLKFVIHVFNVLISFPLFHYWCHDVVIHMVIHTFVLIDVVIINTKHYQ